jgi:hypothetical protein
MNRSPIRAVVWLFTLCLITAGALAKDKAPTQTAWALVVRGPAEVYKRASPGKKVLAHLNSGALVAAFKTQRSRGQEWTQVRVMDLATLEVVTGWAESSRFQKIPVDRYPDDAELEKLMGGEFLEDLQTKYTKLARFLVRVGGQEPALVCYLGSIFLPSTRLQVFESSQGKWTVGPHMEFTSSQTQTGVTEIEVRDLIGDGNECLLMHEPFAKPLGASGINLVIRRIAANGFTTLWQAPLELRNLASYPPKINTLDPPAKNIGAPGTVTKGAVEYKSNGRISEPVWKGKVGFYIPGREEPVNKVNVEKVCPWNGSEFAPLN